MNINEVKSICLKRSERLSLKCQHGTVWATVLGDPRDYIIKAGQEMEFESDQNLVVQSLSNDLEIELGFEKCA